MDVVSCLTSGLQPHERIPFHDINPDRSPLQLLTPQGRLSNTLKAQNLSLSHHNSISRVNERHVETIWLFNGTIMNKKLDFLTESKVLTDADWIALIPQGNLHATTWFRNRALQRTVFSLRVAIASATGFWPDWPDRLICLYISPIESRSPTSERRTFCPSKTVALLRS